LKSIHFYVKVSKAGKKKFAITVGLREDNPLDSEKANSHLKNYFSPVVGTFTYKLIDSRGIHSK
jgi:hypothetical protein